MAEQNAQGKPIPREYTDLRGIKGQFDTELARAIASGDIAKAQELRTQLGLKVESLKVALDPYQLKLRQEIARENGNYAYVGMFSSEGIARAKMAHDNNWTYINKEGRRMIPFSMHEAHPFKEGLGLSNSSSYRFVQPDGSFLRTGLAITNAKDFSEGVAAVRVFGQGDRPEWRYIDRNGNRVINEIMIDGETTDFIERAGSFSSGLAPISQYNQGGWYFIDKSGVAQIQPKTAMRHFFDAKDFSEGLAAVREDTSLTWNYINTKGEKVITGTYAKVQDFSEGLAAVQSHTWMYINKSDEMAIPEIYDQANPFSEGLALVIKDTQASFIDHQGNVKIDLGNRFSKLGSFKEGVAPVAETSAPNDLYYIDHQGRKVFG